MWLLEGEKILKKKHLFVYIKEKEIKTNQFLMMTKIVYNKDYNIYLGYVWQFVGKKYKICRF